MSTGPDATPTPITPLEGVAPYTPPPIDPRLDLFLDANEGPAPPDAALDALRTLDPEALRRYARPERLESELATTLGVTPARVVVTAGADDAIDRTCRAMLDRDRALLVHTTTFEMIERYASLTGARIDRVGWFDGRFPVDAMLDAITDRTRLVALVSPNNPTGASIPTDAMLDIVRATRRVGALVMVDLAYAEFADEDPTPALLEEPNLIVLRTFSKARGLAGARVGYAVCPERVAPWIRASGGPYPVSAPSLALASASLRDDGSLAETVTRIRINRGRLITALAERGVRVLPSDANFVAAIVEDPGSARQSFAERGIAIRTMPDKPGLERLVRITIPGDDAALTRVLDAVDAAFQREIKGAAT